MSTSDAPTAAASVSAAPVDTKTCAHRELRFASLDEVKGELDRIEAAIDAGTIGHTGNWTPGENMDHCARFIRFCIDGFEGRAPAIVRFFARLMFKKKAVDPNEPFPPGFKLPQGASSMLPDKVDAREGLRRVREQIGRIEAGERMTRPSPLLGPLTHEQWLTIHLKHLALHLGFVTTARS